MAKGKFPVGAKVGIALGCVVVAVLGVAAFIKMPGAPDNPDSPGSAGSSASSSAAAGSASPSTSSQSVVEGFIPLSPSSQAASSSGSAAPSKAFGQLMSVSYSESGDMLGSLYAVEAKRTDDGAVLVTVRQSKMHSDPIEVGEYEVSDDLLEQVEAIIDRVGMKEWGELPQSEFVAMDAATESIRVRFEPGDSDDILPVSLYYSFDDELPEGGAQAIRDIHDLMVSSARSGNLVREYTEPVGG